MAAIFKRPMLSGTPSQRTDTLFRWAMSFINEVERKFSSIEESDLSEKFRRKLNEREEKTEKALSEMKEEIERLSAQINELKGE